MMRAIIEFIIGLFKTPNKGQINRLPPPVKIPPEPSAEPPSFTPKTAWTPQETPPPSPIPVEAPRSPAVLSPAIKVWNYKEVNALGNLSLEEFVRILLPLGLEVEKAYGIKPLIAIAQAALESANGNSGLARKGLNLFGIKSGEKWRAKGRAEIVLQTRETDGPKTIAQPFRVYNDWLESLENFAHVIQFNHAAAFDLMQKGKAREAYGALVDYADPMKRYAADSRYAIKCFSKYSEIARGGSV